MTLDDVFQTEHGLPPLRGEPRFQKLLVKIGLPQTVPAG